ncbi:hypothetical protein C8F01DRAFT_1112511 [Mycena amicta]|nr:hypothetical protein C8F01DRAFT_1112511 [Mycena amicta]
MTTRRPSLAHRHRPSSAVYIGGDTTYLSSPPDLPDLPEPPSPGSSTGTSTSGLPSPPATNSTGSGSTGDPGSIAIRGNMLDGNNLKTFHAAFHNNDNDNDDHEYEIDDDGEDNTARLDLAQRRHSASENVLALERVKSLTQRNKIALDKLSSYSRLSSPSPSTRAASSTRSPPPPSLLGSSSSHSNSNSSSSQSSTRPSMRRARTQESGSETERDDVPSTSRPTTPLPARQQLISAPASPQKHLNAASSSSGSSSTRSPRRARVSNLSFSSRAPEEDGPSSPEDITRAALAAVASARRSPGTARYTPARLSPTSATGSGKRRQPLPREWGASTNNGRFSAEPPTSPPQHDASPNKRHSLAGSTASSASFSQQSTRHAHSNSTSSTSTIGSTAYAQGRAATVNKHQSRWLSEDMSMSSPDRDRERERERRQSLRGGSAESALGAGRSLVGEGLRAAGLAGRERDLFSPQDRERERERTPARVEWADGTHSRSQSRQRMGHGRAATSMADYTSARRREDDEYGQDGAEPRTPALRTYRSSAHVLDGASARAGSALGRLRGVSVEREDEREREREWTAPSPSPFGSMRRNGNGNGSVSQHEHTRLMSESLAMFEGHLARVADASSRSATDLARHAQVVVAAAERLNAILRSGTAKALEEQIDAEVSDSDVGTAMELAEVWRRVGGEYREGLRVSDDLVRGVTGFLLDVGRVVRDFGGDGRGSDEGRQSASPDAGRDGRRSAASRHSWEAREGGRDSALAIRDRDRDRPSSVLNTRHEQLRTATPASRRLLTPREQRELQASNGIVPSDSQETVQPGKYEPSPTPAQRKQTQTQGVVADRSRTLPPLAIPKPLPTLPSEATKTSTLRRNPSTGDKQLPATGNSTQRRKTLASGTVGTVRGLHPSITTPTTALTPHTVSNSPNPDRMTFPSLSRNDSDKSGVTRSRNNTVTFSRPSTVALAGLQMQHERERERERQRTISGPNADERAAAAAAGPSGSETEKDVLSRKRSSIVGRPRMSLDGGDPSTSGPSHAADRSAAAGLSNVAPRRERRRTVTDIWPPTGAGS